MSTTPRPLRLLLLSTASLLPPRTGTDLRVVHLARGLASCGHQVDAVSWIAGNYPARRDTSEAGLTLDQRHCAALNLALVLDRLRLVPITELGLRLRALRRQVTQLVRAGDYDLVQCDQPWFAYVYTAIRAAAGPEVPIVYSAHNVETEWWAPRLRRYLGGGWFQSRFAKHEDAALRADALVACSEGDAAALQLRVARPAERICVIPNGFDGPIRLAADPAARAVARARLGLAAGERVALFIGARNEPNAEAVRAILREVAPRMADAATRFLIVGRVGELFPDRAPAAVTITGHVADIAPYFEAADIGLNPVLSGSGSNVKLIEYCAAGLPVVTTEFGLRGFETLRPWLMVRAIADFPEAIGGGGGEVPPPEILEAFTWRKGAAELAAFYERLATARGRILSSLVNSG